MNYLDEIQNAKEIYEVRIALAKEKWVKSPNNWYTTNEYDKELQASQIAYDISIKTIRNKYLVGM